MLYSTAQRIAVKELQLPASLDMAAGAEACWELYRNEESHSVTQSRFYCYQLDQPPVCLANKLRCVLLLNS
ncbi:UNVERIFIED_CONTAM: hypothetical protein FKN15_005142 [Acipenser sinensis]